MDFLINRVEGFKGGKVKELKEKKRKTQTKVCGYLARRSREVPNHNKTSSKLKKSGHDPDT